MLGGEWHYLHMCVWRILLKNLKCTCQNEKKCNKENPQVKQESFPEPFLVLQDVLTQQDNPSCSCRRPAERGGQLPRVCLFPSLPPCYILSRQAARIVELLFSCQTETFTHCSTTAQSGFCIHSIGLTRVEWQVSEENEKEMKEKKEKCFFLGHQLQAR